MALFCGNCGTQVQDGVKFCPSCGVQIDAAPLQNETPRQDYTTPEGSGAPIPDDIKDAQDNKIMSVLAYILFFIPLLTGAHKNSPFVKYHTNQGTVLFIVTVAWRIGGSIILAILRWILWGGIYGLFATVLNLLGLVLGVLCVVGIINAVNGHMKPLPVIGWITIIK